MGSLQDQLLKAGLTSEHKLKVAKSEKRKQNKKFEATKNCFVDVIHIFLVLLHYTLFLV